MTKRSVANDIEELNEEVLGDLSHDERVQIFLEASAKGRESWQERLTETAPQAIYIQKETGFTSRMVLALTIGQIATVQLQGNALRYLWTSSAYKYSAALTILDEEIPSHPVVSVEGIHPTEFLLELYLQTEAYRRFADEELGVSLETWLSVVPEGADVIETVTDILESEADRLERWQSDAGPFDGVPADLPDEFDAAIEDRYTTFSKHYRDDQST